MIRKQRLPELLAPAGGPQAAYAAIEAGADAIYLGLNEGISNARIGAENFSRASLCALIPYAHATGVKVYLTLNTLVYETELEDILSLARFASDAGCDAFIVADLGLARLLSLHLPHMPLHASTQAFAHNTLSADALYRLGFSRVVLARECDKESIQSITAQALAETEVFVHGAICVCHSGQCLFSSVVGGRSGNRGACAQPCRLPYENGKYPLSLKDMCLAEHVPALIESGVASLKIEGRMKSPSYVYTVTSVYRRLLDENRAAGKEELCRLQDAFSRSGFTDGYYRKNLGKDMLGIRREQDKEASRTLTEQSFSPRPIPVTACARIQKDIPSFLSLTATPKNAPSVTVCAEGAAAQAAENAALQEDAVKARFAKLGGDGMCMEKIDLQLDTDLFLPVGAQNALRRDAAAALLNRLAARTEENDLAVSVNEATLTPSPLPPSPHTAVFYRADCYLRTDTSLFDAVFLPLQAIEACREKMPNGVIIPPVLMDSELSIAASALRALASRGVKYALVSNLGAIALARSCSLIPIGDLRLNILNSGSQKRYAACGIGYSILSPELSVARAAHFDVGGFVVYGRIPLMLTERCFTKDLFGCQACGDALLTDRRGAKFPMMPAYGHRTLIFNSLPTYLGDTEDMQKALRRLGKHFIFSNETAQEANAIIKHYLAREKLPFPVRRAYK